MKKKKILFITVPFHAGVVEVAGSWIPLYLVYVAGAARAAGFDAEIYDAMTKKVGYNEIRQKIEESKPDYVGVSSFTCTVPDAIKVLELAKSINPAIITIMGGVHPSFMYEEMFSLTESLDYVVRGEGEITVAELLKTLAADGSPAKVQGIAYKEEGRVIATEPRPFMKNFDAQPMGWDLLDWEDYTYFILPGSRLAAVCTSRGCEQECTFCSQQKYWNRTWRGRSPEDVVREMEHLNKTYGVDVILFTDDYPSPDRVRWEGILDLLIEKDLGIKILMETRAKDIIRDADILHKYKKAGIIHIYVGTEATGQECLDYIKKDLSIEESKDALRLLREVGIVTETSMILGLPDETKENITETLRLIIEYNPDFGHFLAIAPWPYSDIYNELKEYIAVKDYRKYNLIDPIIKPKAMTLEEIDHAIIHCYKTFYTKKFNEMMDEKDEFKKNYLITSMKLMMTTSFIKKKMGSLTYGEHEQMPPEMKGLMHKLMGAGHPEIKPDRKLKSSIIRKINIQAPVSRVFEYVTNPDNWTHYVTSLVDVRNISSTTLSAGTQYEWTYRMLGINLDGTGSIIEFEKDIKFSMEMKGAFPIRETFTFQGDEESTLLTFEIRYNVPGKVLGVVADKLVIEKLNVTEAVAVLNKVKDICEAEA
ncbi:MAG: cobalamin-dependent protein [Nitrospiraceae bacterium]|nr:MAG: cobalamin-dependent protein [Nitrospiraceae bacterium]